MVASDRPIPPRIPRDLTREADACFDDDALWENVELTGSIEGSGASDVEIAESRLTAARLTGVEVSRFRLVDCVVEDCDLSGAMLVESSLERVELVDCRLTGAVLIGARMRDVSFTRCKLDGVALRGATGHRARFDDCVLSAADLFGAKLTAARFYDCDLSGADVSEASLTGARFHGSRLDDLRGALGLRGATIDPAQVLALALPLCTALGIGVADGPGTD